MVVKTFYDETSKNEMAVFIDSNKRICIIAGEDEDGLHNYGVTTLSKEDAIALVDELNILISRL